MINALILQEIAATIDGLMDQGPPASVGMGLPRAGRPLQSYRSTTEVLHGWERLHGQIRDINVVPLLEIDSIRAAQSWAEKKSLFRSALSLCCVTVP